MPYGRALARNSLIGAGVVLALIAVVGMVTLTQNGEKSAPPTPAGSNTTTANTTPTIQDVHHYHVKVAESVDVGDRPG